MKTSLLSIAVALLAICAAVPLFLMGVGLEMNSTGSSNMFLKIATWSVMALVAQPIVVIPAVIAKSIIVGAARLVTK